MRVVLDTNVLIRAAARSGSPAREVFERLTEPPHALLISDFFLDELARAMRYPRVQIAHRLDDAGIERHIQDVAGAAVVVTLPAGASPTVSTDSYDDPVIATAVLGKAEVLCTLDRHLRRESVVAYCAQFSVRILTDVELLMELRATNEPMA